MQHLAPEQLDDLAIILQTYVDFIFESATPEQERRANLALQLLESHHQKKLVVEYESSNKILIECVQSDFRNNPPQT